MSWSELRVYRSRSARGSRRGARGRDRQCHRRPQERRWQAIVVAGICAGSWAAAEVRLDANVSDNNLTLRQKSFDPALTGPRA